MLPTTVPKVRKPVPERAPAKPLAGQAPTVRRYRTGQVPAWSSESENPEPDNFNALSARKVTVTKEDARLARLETVQTDHQEPTDEPSRRPERHRRVVVEDAQILEEEQTDKPLPISELKQVAPARPIAQAEIIVEVEEDLDARRQRARERLRKEEVEAETQADPLPVEDDENEDEEMDESSEEEESESEDTWALPSSLPKINFVKKSERQTVVEKEQYEAEEERVRLEQEKLAEERRRRTLSNLKETMARERQAALESANPEDAIIPSDDEDEAAQEKEFELWKLRELQRIRRDREEREKFRQEQLDVERRRHMTDDEVAAEKRRNKEGVKERKFMKYLQKYYHKGAFYAEELGTLNKEHEWTAATGEDRFVDKTLLPAVMQVKNFGRAGRTKYTHLKNEDTSKLDDPWAATTFNPQFQKKMGGFHGGFERPAKKRKLGDTSTTDSSW